jgi:hypothetical protein
MSYTTCTKGSVEVMNSTLVLRDDGRVDCYSSSGYRILDLDSLPEDIQCLVKQQRKDSAN